MAKVLISESASRVRCWSKKGEAMNGPSLVNYGHEVQLAWMPTTTNQDRVFVVTLGRLDRKMGVAEP